MTAFPAPAVSDPAQHMPFSLDQRSHALEVGRHPRVLIVSASAESQAHIGALFEAEGFDVTTAESPWSEAIASSAFDLIILDGRLGEGGALSISRRLASTHVAPIIIISDDADVTDRIIALEVGADDLISRPYDRRELIARARALLRRTSRAIVAPNGASNAYLGTLNIHTRVLIGPSKARVSLAPSLFAIFSLYLSRPGQPMTGYRVAELLGSTLVSPENFRTSIVRIRKKMTEAGFNPNLLSSVRSDGYALDPNLRISIVQDTA